MTMLEDKVSPYRYSSLRKDEIRLLHIEKDESASIFSIVHHHLNEVPEYEAVSYVWGDPTMSHSLRLSKGQTLFVTASLATALPFLTNASRTGRLWIDQITIDQSNISERSDQVKIMGDIYSQCSRCLIWMVSGQNAGGTDVQPQLGHDIGLDIRNFFRSFNQEAISNTWQAVPDEEDNPRKISASSSPIPSKQQSLLRDHLLWFFEHPWFTRTWVYQEFVLAPQPTFLIGDFELYGSEVQSVFKLGWPRSAAWFNTFDNLLNMSKALATVFHKAPGMQFLLAAYVGRYFFVAPQAADFDPLFAAGRRHFDGFAGYEILTYADMLEKLAVTKTQDDRDHVYAFMGLAPCLLNHMSVDYTRSVEETFAAMMKALVKESKSIDFFAYLPYENEISKSNLHLPSWVPNWTLAARKIHIACQDNLFNAAGPGYAIPSPTKCKHVDPPDSAWNELQVAGKIVDTVSFTVRHLSIYQTTFHTEVDPENSSGCLPWAASTLDRFMNELHERGVTESEHISRKALLRTLFMDGVQWASIAALSSGESLYRTDQQTIGIPHYNKAEDLVNVLTATRESIPDNLPHDATIHILHELSQVQYRRRLAYCGNGRFALVPELVEKDDKIAILHGSRIPIALRQRPDGRFIVLGQCFYDGAMYGGMADQDDNDANIFTLI